MKYDINGSYRIVGPNGKVTINRSGLAPLSAAELDARIKTGEFRLQQFKDAVANMKRLRAATPTGRYENVTQRVWVPSDVARLG